MTPELEALPYRPCVGVMLVNNRGLIFTAQRIDSPSPAWQMPQGGIDKGEDVEAAAFRELFEETGVSSELASVVSKTEDWITYDLPEELIGKLWKGKYRGQKQKWFLMRYSGTDDQIDISQEPREFSRWKWTAPDELVDQIVPFKRHVYAAVLDAFLFRFQS